uniref:SAM-dependent MTase TRM10-type domain-containing protein n=1 Tax=Steinernema glaseri TaxID=37863 RepID=A0A1I7YSS0_9BILA
MVSRGRLLRFLCTELPTCSKRRCYGIGMPPPTRGEGFGGVKTSKFDVFGDKLNIEVPAGVLPPKEFVDKLRHPVQQDKLAKLISELTVSIQDKLAKLISELTLIYKLSPTVPTKMSISQWQRYFGLKDVREREDFLYTLHFEELNEKKRLQEMQESAEQKKKISEQQQVLHERGEMVYARRFHQLLDIRGPEFRKQIDAVYGSRLLQQEAMGEKMPQLIVDCQFFPNLSDKHLASYIRQIQSLHDRNWFHRRPFRITVANLIADPAAVRLMKRYWTFLYGPRARDDLSMAEMQDMNLLDNVEESSDDEEAALFKPHPMIPRISTRGVRDVLESGVKPEEVAYISSTSHKILDGPLDRFKAFVLCSTLDSKPWSSALHAAQTERLPAYRLPFDLYVKWRRGNKVLPHCNVAAILRDVYTGDKEWKSAIIANVPDYKLSPDENKAPTRKQDLNPAKVKRLEREERIALIEKIMKDAGMRKMDISNSVSKQRNEAIPRKAIAHRYSREERNRRREENRGHGSS